MKDRTGEKYNRLTAIKFSHKQGNNYFWLFRCDCGKEKVLNLSNVTKKKLPTLSCGCATNSKYTGLQALQYTCFNDCGYSDGNLTFEEFVDLSQKPCLYCNKQAKDSNCRKTRIKCKKARNTFEFYYNGLDRVDNSKPHLKNNVVPCCARCNSWKQNLSFKEFKEIINNINYKITDLYL